MIKYLLFLGIEVYQRTISPDHGVFNRFFPNGYCRFYPSCSEFTKKALLKHGALKGSCMGFRRILRCNPWSKASIDEVL